MRLSRAQVPRELTWNLDDLFADHASWEAELARIAAARPQVTRYRGRLGESAATLLGCLDAREALMESLMRAGAYASLLNAGDGTDPAHQASVAQVDALQADVDAAVSFIDPEILQLPDGVLESFQAAEPGLAVHASDLRDVLQRKAHTLSAQTENALASLSELFTAPFLIYQRSKSSDMQFEPFMDPAGKPLPNSFNLYEWTYESHPDAALRRNAWSSFCDGMQRYSHAYAATFATEVKKNVVLARLRGYESAEHMLLQPHKVPFDFYAGIIHTLQETLAPHMRRYARLRRRVLGLDRLRYCDLKAPLDPGYNPAIGFAEASALILGAVDVMGEEYGGLMRAAFRDRWIDRADNVGKSSGAFCASPYGAHPFILVTWTDTMRDAFVLAHELGHAGHFALAMRNQRFVNLRPAMPFVEAPSTMNEMLLARHILRDGDGDARQRRWVAMQTLGTFHHNFVTHLLEAELLRQAYALAEAGEAITASVLNQRKAAILSKFWGDAVEIDDGAALTWMRQPHYYFGLYPYTYSVGLAASTAMAKRVAEEGEPAVSRWLQVLKAGGTLDPLDLLKVAGIDMSSMEPVREAVAYVGSLVDEVEASF